jgi:uncharacterized membrane protein
MKTVFVSLLAALAIGPVQAQIFHPGATSGATVGAIAGAIIGNNSGHHNAWRGAAIGAGAGLLLGSAIESDYRRGIQGRTQVPYPHGPYTYYRHAPGFYPSGGHVTYYYNGYYGRPSYASSGLFWGGLAGAIIGNNSGHHNTWRGAAIGAGAGLLLGSIIDDNIRNSYYVERPVVIEQSANPVSTQTQQPPQNVTIINNYYGTNSGNNMSQANSMFGR